MNVVKYELALLFTRDT